MLPTVLYAFGSSLRDFLEEAFHPAANLRILLFHESCVQLAGDLSQASSSAAIFHAVLYYRIVGETTTTLLEGLTNAVARNYTLEEFEIWSVSLKYERILLTMLSGFAPTNLKKLKLDRQEGGNVVMSAEITQAIEELLCQTSTLKE